ncbi:MAG: SDR family NAD(P)-dependent oxidoreductase [Caldilineaceae bacterium]
MRLHDKVAIITGAGRGIGRATALRFAEEGARVVCADLDLAFVTEVADEINACASGANGRAPCGRGHVCRGQRRQARPHADGLRAARPGQRGGRRFVPGHGRGRAGTLRPRRHHGQQHGHRP